MKKLTKLMSLMLALAMIFTLASCGQSGEKKTESGKAEVSKEETASSKGSEDKDGGKEDAKSGKSYEIGVAIYQYNDNFMTLYRKELQKYFDELSAKDGKTYHLEFQDGKNDQSTQTEQLKNFIAQKKDLIIANLVDPTGSDAIIQEAKAANIPVVFVNREPTQETMGLWPGKITYVGVDARQSGIFQGDMIANLENKGDVNGDGKVSYLMIMGDAGNVDAEQRTKYSIETLEKAIKTEKLDEQRGNWDQAKGQEIAANALSKNGNSLEVIFSNNDGMALGAIQAIKSAGRTVNKDIYIVGVDALPEVVELIGKNEFTGTVLNDYYNQAHTAAEIGIEMLNGKDVKPYYWHDYVKVQKPEDSQLKRLEYRAETMEEYQKRLKDQYGTSK